MAQIRRISQELRLDSMEKKVCAVSQCLNGDDPAELYQLDHSVIIQTAHGLAENAPGCQGLVDSLKRRVARDERLGGTKYTQQDLKRFAVLLEHLLPAMTQEGLFMRPDPTKPEQNLARQSPARENTQDTQSDGLYDELLSSENMSFDFSNTNDSGYDTGQTSVNNDLGGYENSLLGQSFMDYPQVLVDRMSGNFYVSDLISPPSIFQVPDELEIK